MSRLRTALTASVFTVLLPCTPAAAQEIPVVAYDIGVGRGHGFGGPPTDDRDLFVFSATVAVSIYRLPDKAVLLAYALDGQVASIWQRVCPSEEPRRCPDYPGLHSRAVMVGYTQLVDSRYSVRVLAGPARVTHGYSRQRGAGALVRVDWTLPFTQRVDVTTFGQGLVAPSWSDYRFGTVAAGAGLRVKLIAR